MMRKLKLVGVASCLVALMGIISCGQQFQEPFDSEEQLEIDIELIEAFLDQIGQTEYDTLEGDVRVFVLEEGTGESIEPNDIISYHYLGRFLAEADTLFDTSIGQLALDQDLRNVSDTVFLKSKKDTTKDSLDIDGNKIIQRVNYDEGYFPIFSPTRNYTTAKTTHTTTGWFTEQVLANTVAGYAPAVNYALFNCNIGGSILAILPSSAAYGRFGSGSIAPNTVIMFEIRPVQKR